MTAKIAKHVLSHVPLCNVGHKQCQDWSHMVRGEVWTGCSLFTFSFIGTWPRREKDTELLSRCSGKTEMRLLISCERKRTSITKHSSRHKTQPLGVVRQQELRVYQAGKSRSSRGNGFHKQAANPSPGTLVRLRQRENQKNSHLKRNTQECSQQAS